MARRSEPAAPPPVFRPHQVRTLMAIMLASFSLTFAILWLQREPPDAPPPPLAGAPHAPIEALARRMSASAPSEPARATPAVVRGEPAALPSSSAPVSNEEGPPLPVIFGTPQRVITRLESDAEDNSRRVTKNVTEALVINTSDKPLALSVTELNVATQETWQAQVVVVPQFQKRFGEDVGLKMASGDQLTLRNPAFQALTRSIP